MGMGVDSNVLIFERIREELRIGKTVRAAVDGGYEKAWVTIFDSHVTTLITTFILFIFGDRIYKGFCGYIKYWCHNQPLYRSCRLKDDLRLDIDEI